LQNSRSPSKKAAEISLLGAHNMQRADFLKHASKTSMVRFIQDPVAVAGTSDDLNMNVRSLRSVASIPKKPGDIGTERRSPVVFDKQIKRTEKNAKPVVYDDPHPSRF